MHDYQHAFLKFSVACGVLRFGEFTLKSGRKSPYFFNTGLFNTGARLAELGRYYAAAAQDSGIAFDMLFGPAYKGIPLVSALAIALADHHGRNLPYCFNRKEAKQHAEGGRTVGHAIQGRVLIVDDVISAGLSVGESVEIIRAAGAAPTGVLIALDRQERGETALSAAQEVQQRHGVPVASIVRLDHVLTFLADRGEQAHRGAILAYRETYGAG